MKRKKNFAYLGISSLHLKKAIIRFSKMHLKSVKKKMDG